MNLCVNPTSLQSWKLPINIIYTIRNIWLKSLVRCDACASSLFMQLFMSLLVGLQSCTAEVHVHGHGHYQCTLTRIVSLLACQRWQWHYLCVTSRIGDLRYDRCSTSEIKMQRLQTLQQHGFNMVKNNAFISAS